MTELATNTSPLIPPIQALAGSGVIACVGHAGTPPPDDGAAPDAGLPPQRTTAPECSRSLPTVNVAQDEPPHSPPNTGPNWDRVGELLWEAILSEAEEDSLGHGPGREGRVKPDRAWTDAEKVVEMLFPREPTSPREISARLHWSRSRTQRALTQLHQGGTVVRTGRTRAATYHLSGKYNRRPEPMMS